MPAEFKGLSPDLYISWILFRQGVTVPNFMIAGYL